jgi:hypothetical protein
MIRGWLKNIPNQYKMSTDHKDYPEIIGVVQGHLHLPLLTCQRIRPKRIPSRRTIILKKIEKQAKG